MADYPITVDQLEDGHALVLGTTGSGKTYQLRGMLEQLRGADRRVGAIDKLGNHWGLTLAPNGKDPGLDFVIFGGKRAQVPMTPDQGALLGALFVERNVPAIFDVSQWHSDDQQRWVAAFADAVFMTNQEAALHLALDEAQSWVPQGGGGEAFRAVQRMAEQGRGNGIRLLMSCQRLSRLDATVRGMVHLVVAMRQPGVLDRKAVKDLIAATSEDLALLDRDLPKMPTGTGYRWSADGAELTKIKFPANATFDSSRTPRHGDAAPAPIAVSSALVEELKAALAPAAKPESQNSDYPDDTIPRDATAAYAKGGHVGSMLAERDARIAELETVVADQAAELVELRDVDAALDRQVAGLAAIADLVDQVQQGRANLHRGDAVSRPSDADSHPTKANPAVPKPKRTRSAPRPSSDQIGPAEAALTTTARDVASMLLSAAPGGISWDNALLLTGRRPGSGDAGKARAQLLNATRPGGSLTFIEGGKFFAAAALLDHSDVEVGHWPRPDKLVELWAAKLRGPGGDILRDIAAHGPSSRADVGARIGKAVGSGWFGKGMKDLRRSNLVEERADGILHLHRFLQDQR